jgi:hypothetical protein
MASEQVGQSGQIFTALARSNGKEIWGSEDEASADGEQTSRPSCVEADGR